jgi:hypothetical protein
LSARSPLEDDGVVVRGAVLVEMRGGTAWAALESPTQYAVGLAYRPRSGRGRARRTKGRIGDSLHHMTSDGLYYRHTVVAVSFAI